MANNKKFLANTSFVLFACAQTLAITTCYEAEAKLSKINGKSICAAQSTTGAQTSSGSTATAPNTAAASSPANALALSKTEEQQLRRMSEALKRTKRAAGDLIMECTQPVEMIGEIDIIGTDVIPIMPQTAEGFGNQYVEPRPKYVNLHMQQLGQLIPILQDDINTLTIPDEEKTYAMPLVKDLNSFMQDIGQHFKNLQALTIGTDYDQNQIVAECQSIDSAMKSIDKARKMLLHEDILTEKQDEKAVRKNK